jgi:gliding motility-associated-like protein
LLCLNLVQLKRLNMKSYTLLCALLLFSMYVHSQVCLPKLDVKQSHDNNNKIIVNCEKPLDVNGCLKLKVDYSKVNSTLDYEVLDTPFFLGEKFNLGNKIKITSEDRFSDIVKLPFPFCFYGNTYNDIVIGNNGIVSFDTNLANQNCPWNIVGSLPNPNLVRNAIFGVYHDLSNTSNLTCKDNPNTPENECGEIYIYTEGVAPCRKFTISFDKMSHFNCVDKSSTFKIVLYETTNVIDVIVQSKPISCDKTKEKRALIGIQNDKGTKALFPNERNTGIWNIENTSYRFSPSGETKVDFTWKDKQGNIISNEQNPLLCNLEGNTSVFVEAIFNSCIPIKVEKEFLIEFASDYPFSKSLIYEVCDKNNNGNENIDLKEINTIILNGRNRFTIKYYNTKEDALKNINTITSNVLVEKQVKKYFYRLEKDANCFSVNSIDVKIGENLANNLKLPKKICDVGADGKEKINLTTLNEEIINNQNNLTLSYHTTLENAQNNIQPINEFTITKDSKVFVRIVRNGGCLVVSEIIFELIAQKTEIINIQGDRICSDNQEVIHDFTKYEIQFNDYTNSKFSYFKTQNDAITQKNEIDAKNIKLTNSTDVFVRIFNKTSNCVQLAKINVLLNKFPIIQNALLKKCDEGHDNKETFNLNEAVLQMTTSNNLSYDFYTTYEAALNKDSKFLISKENAINYTTETKTIFVRFDNKITTCNAISNLLLKVIPIPKLYSKSITFCSKDDKKEAMLNLEDYNKSIIGDQQDVKVIWYKNESDAKNNQNEIFSIFAKNKTQVWVRLIGGDFCIRLFPVIIDFIKAEVVNNPSNYTIKFCDYQNDKTEFIDLTTYVKDIFGTDEYQDIKFYRTFSNKEYSNPVANPTYFDVFSVKELYVNLGSVTCQFIARKIVFSPFEGIDAKTITTSLCDADNSKTEFVNLNDYISQIIGSSKVTKTSFYVTYPRAYNGLFPILNATNFEIKESKATIFVRLENVNGCINVQKINFELFEYPKQKQTLKICDKNNDKVEPNYELNQLNKFLNDGNQNYKFAYFESQNDADLNKNPLSHYTLLPETKLFVKITNGSCLVLTQISFDFMDSTKTENLVIDKICDINSDGVELIDLKKYENQFVDKLSVNSYRFEYYKTENDAVNGTNVIDNPLNYQISTDDYTIFIRVYNQNNCFEITKLQVILDRKILVKDAKTQYVCDFFSNTHGTTNLKKYIPEMIDDITGLQIDFFKFYDDAFTNLQNKKIINPENYELDAISNIVYVRFFNPILGCFSIRNIPINLQLPPKLVDQEYLICDNDIDGFYDVNLTELNQLVISNYQDYKFTYHLTEKDATDKVNLIKDYTNYKTSLPSSYVYLNVDNGICSSITKVNLIANKITETKINSIDYSSCEENDGKFTVDLTRFVSQFKDGNVIVLSSLRTNSTMSFYKTESDSKKNINSIPNPSSYLAGNETIFIRVLEDGYCPTIVKINTIVKPKPVLDLPKFIQTCVNVPATIQINLNIPNENIVWKHGKTGRTISELPGVYTVTVTDLNGCSTTQSIEVKEIELPKIKQLITNENTITVVGENQSKENLMFSIDDGKTWVSSDTFTNLLPGKHTFIIQNKLTGCISLPKSTVVLDLRNVITPNGDGVNDSWKLSDLSVFEGELASITIFDRYGKLIHADSSSSHFEWTGIYGGRPLPSTSYWYEINIPDGRHLTGYIVVKNRD